MENKGQVKDQYGKSRKDVQYSLTAAKGLNIFIGNGAIHYQFSKCNNADTARARDIEARNFAPLREHDVDLNATCDMYRMDVELIGADKHAQVITEEQQGYYENYYTPGTGENGATAHAYNRITYKNVYPHIDWVLYTSTGQLKHEFLVHKGGRPGDIQLKYGGATKLKTDNAGTLIATTPQGSITEQAPYSYQQDGKQVKSAFKLKNNTLSYETDSYEGDLVIDPGLEWATYYGGTGGEIAFSIARDSVGDIYITGMTSSAGGIATTGAYQVSLTPFSPADVPYDGFLAKFNSNGGLLWATYYGGVGRDEPRSVATSTSGSIYIAGYTACTSGIATAGAYQAVYGGGVHDGFLVKFNASGMRDWGTYYGGDDQDDPWSVAVDRHGDVYIAGNSHSASGIASSGGFQTTMAGHADAFLAKFSSSGLPVWSTYYGGAEDDYGPSVVTDTFGNVYLAGWTRSTTGIATSGAYKDTYGGGYTDGFLAKFSESGGRVWATYYGGSMADGFQCAVTDDTGNVYISGYKDQYDVALAKMNSSGALLWDTVYGGSGNDFGWGIALDAAGAIYVTGSTASSSGIATADAFQSSGGSDDDVFLAKFDNSGSLKWGTYYGGPGTDDFAQGILADNLGYVYVTGKLEATTGLTTAGAYQSVHAGGYPEDAFIAKFRFCPSPVVSSVAPAIADPGASVSIAGDRFNSFPAQNIVYFGATRATVNAAVGDSLLYVTVPIGATYMPVTVTDSQCGLIAYSQHPFLPVYDTTPFIPSVINFDTMRNYSVGGTYFMNISDLDGDGKGDLVVFKYDAVCRISLFHNTSVPGPLTASSFDLPVGFTVDHTNPTNTNPEGVAVGDIDGDGKPDLVASGHGISNFVSIYRNTSIPGTLDSGSFAARVDFDFEPHNDDWSTIVIADIDADGKPDLIIANRQAGKIALYHNQGRPGVITASSFAPKVEFDVLKPYSIAAADIDGDGKVDLAVTGAYNDTLSVFRNTSTPGIIDAGSFAAPAYFTTGHRPRMFAIGDLDNDNKPEIVVANYLSQTVSVFHNTAISGGINSSSFSPAINFATDTCPNKADIADINGDGKPDIVVASGDGLSGTGSVGVFRNTTSPGLFSPTSFAPRVQFGTNACATQVAIGDLDGDKLPDLAISYYYTFSTNISVLRNNPFRQISGLTHICPGDATTLTSNIAGGAWSSGSPAVATIGSSNGIVFGLTDGTADITYTIPGGSTHVVVTVDTMLCRGSDKIITTVAGSGAGVYTEEGGPATNAHITHANDVVTDRYGNLYIAIGNYRILKVTTDGTIHTVAGNGTNGYSGDGGPATAAQMGTAYFLTLDTAGNIYFSNYAEHRVRKVSTSGIISTIAGTGIAGYSPDGTVATAAQITYPWGVAVDGTGNVYIGEGARIRKIDGVSGLISTVAGNGTTIASGDGGPATAAGLGAPHGITVDAAGNIFIANFSSSTVRKVSLSGIITTIAGSSTHGFAGDGGPATSAKLDDPEGVVLDAAGNLYVADLINGRIRRIDPAGIITTFAGNGYRPLPIPPISPTGYFSGDGCAATAASLDYPDGVCVDRWGNLYIADGNNQRVRKVSNNHNVRFAGGHNQSLTVASGSLMNAINPVFAVLDADIGQPETWNILVPPLHGSVTVATSDTSNGGLLTPAGATYTPAIGYYGYDSFRVRVTDCGGGADTTTVIVSVTGNVPIVLSVTPNFAIPGNVVTISGLNFNAAPTQNIVYFGATRATVLTASTTLLNVSVPVGATYMPVSVNNAAVALAGYSPQQFLPIFDTTPYITNVVNFSPRIDLPTTNPVSGGVAISDLNGDGRPDIVYTSVAGASPQRVALLRNTALPGTLSAASFAAPAYLSDLVSWNSIVTTDIDGDGKPDIVGAAGALASSPVMNYVSICRNRGIAGALTSGSFEAKVDLATGLDAVTEHVATADIDGDGKPEVIVANQLANTISVFPNNCTAGIITTGSFGTRVDLSTTDPYAVAAADMDGDGKVDLVVANRASNTITIFRNTSTPGTINSSSFAAPVSFSTGSSPRRLALGDLDGDGKPEVVVPNRISNTVSVFRNTAVAGSISASSLAAPVNFTAGTAPDMAAISDMDGDGSADIVIVNAAGATISVLLNASIAGGITASSFFPPVDFAVNNNAFMAAIGDLDGDTKPDIAVTHRFVPTNSYNSLSLLRNNPLKHIFGTPVVCVAGTTTLSNATTGGTWSSAGPSIATVDPVSGVVTGVATGTAVISYSVVGGSTSIVVTVSALSYAGTITGLNSVCAGFGLTFTDPVTGGTWSSSNPAVATVGATGIMSAIAAGTTTISYTVNNGCGPLSATKNVTVDPVADTGTLVGSAMVCPGVSMPFSDTALGGVWSSSNPAAATISVTGTVTGIALGITTISYTVTNGCGTLSATRVVTVTATPNAGTISGPSSVCVGGFTSLTSTVPGGTWSSTLPLKAAINPIGTVIGISAGTTIISYALNNGCGIAYASRVMTVNVAGIAAVSGPSIVCEAGTITMSDATPGGTWSSSVPGIAAVGTTGIVTGMSAGTATISYTVTNGCGTAVSSQVVTVDPLPAPGIITGAGSVCAASSITLADPAPGGVWSSSAPGVATVGTGGVVTGVAAGAATIRCTVTNGCGSLFASHSVSVNPLPDPGTISGTASACAGSTTVLSASTAGIWSSANTSVATIGISGTVSAIAAGTSVISHTATNGCGTAATTTVMTVNALPVTGIITGAAIVCAGSSITLTNGVSGGTWASSNMGVAAVGSTGTVSGISAGTTTITYTVTNGCGVAFTTQVITVNPLPVAAAISGSGTVCMGTVSSFTDATTGGVWSSSNTAIATVTAAGNVNGHAAGTGTISYTVTNGCGTISATLNVTVNPLAVPGVITGPGTVCESGTASLADAVAGGTWASSNSAVATVGSTGVVSGVVSGTARISYTVTNVCGGIAATRLITVIPLPASITGPSVVCEAANIILVSPTTGGVYTSGNTAIASVFNIATGAGRVTGVAAGPAVITYTRSGCATTTVVTINPLPHAGPITGSNTACPGTTTALADITSGGVWTSSNNMVATVGSTGIVTGAGAGTTTIYYTTTNSCGNASSSRIITIYPIPVPGTISGPSSVCAGGGTIMLSHTGIGAVWSSSNSTIATASAGLVTGVSGGTVIISYNVSNSCGSAHATKVITVDPLPDAGTITGTTEVCTGSTITLASTVAGGAWSSESSSVAAIDVGTGVVTGVSSGAVYISYTTGNVCGSSVVKKVVTVNPLPNAGIITGTPVICPGNTTLLTDAYTSGTWSSTNGSVADIGVTGIVTGMAAGTTTISYTTNTVCGTAAATLVVTVNPSADAGILSGPATVCGGNTTTLSSTFPGGVWSSSATTTATAVSGGIITGHLAGTALISYTVTNSCGTAVAITTITVSPLPDAGAISGLSSVCAGSIITLADHITGGSWSSSNMSIAGVGSAGSVTGIGAGMATISYTMNNSCGTASVTRIVTVNLTPTAIGGPANVCKGSTVALSNATPGGTWSSTSPNAGVGAATGVVTGDSKGSATISYILANGCYSTLAFRVDAQPENISGSLTVCEGTVTRLTISPAISTAGTWSSSNTGVAAIASDGLLSGVAAGTTTISFITAAGCSVSTIVTVTPTPSAISGTGHLCMGESTTYTSTTSGGIWSSSNATVASVGALSGIVSAISAGTSVITYRAGGCIQTSLIRISRPPAAIAGTLRVCEGAVTILDDINGGGEWVSADTTIAAFAVPSGEVRGVAAGTVTISYISNGCPTLAVLTVNALPAAISGADHICAGDAVTLSCATVGGMWSGDNHAVSVGSLSGVVTGLWQGTATIQYTLPTGCNRIHQLTVNPLPGAIGGTLRSCKGASSTLFCTVGTEGTWTSSNASVAAIGSTDGVVTGMAAGTSVITYSANATACYATAVFTVNPVPVSITVSGNICEGGSSTVTGIPAGGYWQSDRPGIAAADSTSGSITGVSAGVADISYWLHPACVITSTVTVYPRPFAISGDLSVCEGVMGRLYGAPAGGTWSGSTTVAAVAATTGKISGIEPGNATITYTAINGCKRTVEVTVNELPAPVSGQQAVCVGDTIRLANSTMGGIWSSKNVRVATVTTGGLVRGIIAGTTYIGYTLGTGCASGISITVHALPAAITGTTVFCAGTSVQLTDNTLGGTWGGSSGVVSVDMNNGTVTGNTTGTTTVTYTSADGCMAFAGVTVITTPEPAIITGGKEVCTLHTIALSASEAGGAWTSGDPGIAAIAGAGLIAGVKAGHATISYTLGNVCGFSAAVAEVTVRENIYAGNISGPDVVCPDDSVALTSSVPGGNWISSNNFVVSVGKTGIVKSVGLGTTTIRYALANSCSTDTAMHTVKVQSYFDCFPTTRRIITDFDLYPNPTRGVFTFETPVAGTLTIYNVDGRLVMQHIITAWVTNLSLPSGTPNGIYLCNFVGYEGTTLTMKLVYEP